MKNLFLIFIIYYFIISIIGIILTIADKKKAQKGKWRIPEATLMICGLLGAALPMYLTMKKIRHKTKHNKFMIGLPAEMVIHVVIIIAVTYILSSAV